MFWDYTAYTGGLCSFGSNFFFFFSLRHLTLFIGMGGTWEKLDCRLTCINIFSTEESVCIIWHVCDINAM